MAKKYSEDDASKVNGGDLDYFGKGRMVPEFEAAAFAMQPGQISDLVKSQFGFHIIKVVDKKAASTRPLDESARANPGDSWPRSASSSKSRAQRDLDTRIDQSRRISIRSARKPASSSANRASSSAKSRCPGLVRPPRSPARRSS